MARRGAAAALAGLAFFLAFAAVAAQGPCIQCSECRTNNCWQNCRPTCPNRPPPRPPRPDQIAVNGNACKSSGFQAGLPVARDACETTRRFCRGGRSAAAPRTTGGFVTNLAQCSNIALGACQQVANNAQSPSHPCGRELRNGLDRCSARQFREFFEGETRDLCTNAARSITGVQPGTNQWAGSGNRPRTVAAGSIPAAQLSG